ncbi:MAG: protein kinase [Candidatus Aminicenantes bacterium]|nr:protein kinase [Candidatus Aminicenantes bacterium]
MKCPECKTQNPDGSTYCNKCGRPLKTGREKPVFHTKTIGFYVLELEPGEVFAGRYQVLEELGRGGMGRVYKVLDTDLKEQVALKLINPDVASEPKNLERFRNELKTARRIIHKNVCRMYHLSEHKGVPYITMEFIPGEDLKTTLHRVGQLSLGKAVSIAEQICEGLTEAHRLGIVHRDLKPQNIMIDREGNARIMDFGIARSQKMKGITDAGMIIGTPEYISPEQVDGKKADGRADIYAFGVILFEMLTGRVPFTGETPLNVAFKHKTEKPPGPKTLNPLIEEKLNGIILKCLEKDKEKRYGSAEELLEELRKIGKKVPTTADLSSRKKKDTGEITVKFSLKKNWAVLAAIVAILLLALSLWWFVFRKGTAPSEPGRSSLAVMYFQNNTGDENLDHWRRAIAELLIADLSQSKFIHVLSGDRLYDILVRLGQEDTPGYSTSVLKEVAEKGQVKTVLTGGFSRAGDLFRINYLLQDPRTGERLASDMVEVKGQENIFTMVDEMTKKIKSNFELSAEEMAADIDLEVEEITTSSSEAYRSYSEGRRAHFRGDYKASIKNMEEAIKKDPEFAMAYRSLAAAHYNLGHRSLFRENMQKALELTYRVSERERYLIQGDYYLSLSERTYDKAAAEYLKLLELYPDDRTANINLGSLYRIQEEWEKAAERFEVNKRNNDATVQTYTNLSDVYLAQGKFDEARKVLEEYLNRYGSNAGIHTALSRYYLSRGEFDFAEVQADRVLSLKPELLDGIILKGDIQLCRENLSAAEKEYNRLLKKKDILENTKGRERLAALNLLQGKFRKASALIQQSVAELEKTKEREVKAHYKVYLAYIQMLSGDPKQGIETMDTVWEEAGESLSELRFGLFIKGLLYLRKGDVEEGRRTVEELRMLLEDRGDKKTFRYQKLLSGLISLEEGDQKAAFQDLEKAVELLPFPYAEGDQQALFYAALGKAAWKNGNLAQASAVFEQIGRLTMGRIFWGDVFARSFFHLARVYIEQGRKQEAFRPLETFLSLFKDSDENVSETGEARKTMKELTQNSGKATPPELSAKSAKGDTK